MFQVGDVIEGMLDRGGDLIKIGTVLEVVFVDGTGNYTARMLENLHFPYNIGKTYTFLSEYYMTKHKLVSPVGSLQSEMSSIINREYKKRKRGSHHAS